MGSSTDRILTDEEIERLRPMSEWFESGCFDLFNLMALWPEGLHMGQYLDDDAGRNVLGFEVITLDDAIAQGVVPSPAERRSRLDAFEAFCQTERERLAPQHQGDPTP